MQSTTCTSRRAQPSLVCRQRPPAFRERQHSRLIQARGVVPIAERNGWWLKHPQPNLHDLHSLQDMVALLEQNTDRLVMIEFFAPWCASCKALYPKLSKLCHENPNIVIGKVNFEDNREIAKKLGVKVLPFFHAYHGSMGRVAGFSASITKIKRVRDCISMFGQPYCDLQGHNGQVDISQSLPEFDSLPTPDDATVLQFCKDGIYDQDASIAKKASKPMPLDAEAEAVVSP